MVNTDLPQRIFSEYEVPKNSTLLDMIEVRATRLPMEDTDYRVRRPYGKPDAVLTSKDPEYRLWQPVVYIARQDSRTHRSANER